MFYSTNISAVEICRVFQLMHSRLFRLKKWHFITSNRVPIFVPNFSATVLHNKGLRHDFVSFLTGSLHPFVADIEESAWATLVCLGSRLELDVSINQPMHSLNQALDFPFSFRIESL